MKKVVMITLSILAMGILIFYFGIKTIQSKYGTFEDSGYIITKIYDQKGNYLKSEKYYFNNGTKYKENYKNQVEFNTINNEETVVDSESFVHFDNGGLSTLKKAAILNLDTINAKTAVKYYNIYPETVMEYTNTIYSINNIKTKLEFNNFLMKISDTKFLIVGRNLRILMPEKDKTIDYGYYEFEFIEGDIVRIENNEVSIQAIPINTRLELGNGISIDLGSKYISKGEDKNILNLNEITINSDDNIEIIPIEEEEKEEENKKNPIAGLGDGIVNTEKPDDEEEVNEHERQSDPQFQVSEMNITSNKLQTEVQVLDISNVLQGDITMKVIESSTNKIVYQTKEPEGTMNLMLEVENLSPNTSYIFVVNSEYSKNNNDYTRDFIQKTFITESVGVSISKDLFTTESLSFLAKKKDYSNIKSFDATLLDNSGRVVEIKKIEFSGMDKITFDFTSLTHNSEYTLRINNYLYEDSVIADSYIEDTVYKTLKLKPELGNVSFVIDKKDSKFTLKMSNTLDPDNGITSYRYELYDARVVDEQIPVQVVEKNNQSSVDITVDDINVSRGTPYTFKVIAVFNDNEKVYEYETEYSDIMKMDGVAFPSIKFDASEVTFERIKGNIVILDEGNTISLNEANRMTIVYTDSVGVQKTFTSSGNLTIPINVNYLRKNETYTFSVYATVDLQDGNDPIDNCYIGSTIVRTEDTEPFYLTYAVDTANTTSSFKINAKLGPYNNNDSLLEANTMSGLIFNLYEGTSTSGTLVKTVRKVDRNLDEYVSELKETYYDQVFEITPELFNLRNEDLKAEYYTIEVDHAYDYTTYKNEIPIYNNIVTAKTVGFIPSLPDNVNNAIDVSVIRNKDAGSRHRDDLDEETIVGYKIKGLYDNSSRYAKAINYKVYSEKTGQVIASVRYDVPDSGTIGYTTFYIEDGTAHEITDTELRRGNAYYFTYDVELDLNQDGVLDSTFPSDPTITLRSITVKPNKQEPKIWMYPSTSDASSFTWKYKISDIDNAIVEKNFIYSSKEVLKNPIAFNVGTEEYQTVKFTSLVEGYFDVKYKKALIKDDTKIETSALIFQYFDTLYTPGQIEYDIYDEVNRVIFALKDYNTNPFFKRVAAARIEFEAAGKPKVVLDNLLVDNGNIIIDYADIESLMGHDITPQIYLYYDSGVTGYETGSSRQALQMINNGSADYIGEYYYMNTATSFTTSSTPDKSFFNISLDIQNNKLLVLNQFTYITTSMDVTINKSGVSYNYELLFPKALYEKIAVNSSGNPTFRFDSLIPSISLLNDTGALNIAPTLVGVKFKASLYGATQDRIKDQIIYVEIYKTDANGINSTFDKTVQIHTDDLSNIIEISELLPNQDYYFKLKADIFDGTQYIREQLYDIDYQTNTKNYYFKTLNDVGVSAVTANYQALSYDTRTIKLSYSLNETVGYDRIEYEIYKIDPDTGNKIKIDLPIESDYLFNKKMDKTISIPVGCGVETGNTYEILIKPYAVVKIDGVSEDVELKNNNNALFVFNKLAEPYVGISSAVKNEGLEYKVSFYDSYKAVVNDLYTIKITDEFDNDVTPEAYKDVVFSSGSTKRFSVSGLTPGAKYNFTVSYQINLYNGADTISPKSKTYISTMTETNGISIGNFSLVADTNDTTRIRMLFYDSYKLTELDTVRYSIYSSGGYSIDGEEEFTPITLTLQEGIVYYYYTLSSVLPSTGQYYVQIQFLKDNQIIVEENAEYNYIK